MTSTTIVFCLVLFVVTAFDPRNGIIVSDDPNHYIIVLDGEDVAMVLPGCRMVDLNDLKPAEDQVASSDFAAGLSNHLPSETCSTGVILSETDDPNRFIIQKNGQDLLRMVIYDSGECFFKEVSDRVTIRPSETYSLRYPPSVPR